jgi:hypothetical protein
MKITVTRGLAELKTLDSRIQNAIAQGTYVAVVRGSKEVPLNAAVSKDELEKTIQASYQQVGDLIKRRDAIKRAIIVANSKTQVSISGATMTVAEAIERKSSIQYTERLINTLQAQYNSATIQANNQNARVEADVEKRVMAAYGNDKGKVTAEQHDLIAKAVKGEQEAKLLDPKKIVDQIAVLRREYEDFVTEVDFVLSESNARTEIELAD